MPTARPGSTGTTPATGASRYDTSACGAQRIDADAIEDAVTGALASFYRGQHVLIADAIAAAQASHAADDEARRAELGAAEPS